MYVEFSRLFFNDFDCKWLRIVVDIEMLNYV